MGKGGKKPKGAENDEHLDDIMAWGKSKQNYYQQSEQQYSQASEEKDEAQRIYQNQFQNLNEEDYYQLPSDRQNQQEDEEQQQQGLINQSYLKKQILWATELAKMFEGIRDEKYGLRKKIYDSYLLILLALKSFKVSFIDQHPLVQELPLLKKSLKYFEKDLVKYYENLENEQQIQQDIAESQAQNETKPKRKTQSKDEGLQIYEKLKQQREGQRKQKKAISKANRDKKRVAQPFKTVKEHEGRLANQKILKNKVMMKRRRKDDGNSRVKLRHKFEKALVKRKAKGIVGVKQNPGRFYEGQSKVLYGKIASTKLK